MGGFIGRHPIAATLSGLVLLYVLYKMFSGGGSSAAPAVYTSSGIDPTAVQAASALQQSQIAANSQTQQYQLQAQAQNAQIAGAVTVAQLQQGLGMAQIAADAKRSTEQTQAGVNIAAMQAQSTNLASTLAAQVQSAGLSSQVEVAKIGANVTNTQTEAMTKMNEQNQQTIRYQAAQKNKGICFITTAACEHICVPDDGYVLTTLRDWRDAWLMEAMPAEVERYYRIAPGIVARLNTLPHPGAAYKAMWDDFILPAVHCIERGQHRAAFAIYASMVATFEQLAVQGIATKQRIVDSGGRAMLQDSITGA